MNKHKKIITGILAVLILVLVGTVVYSSQNSHYTTGPISILFVGNSHVRTGNIPGQLQALASLHGIEIIYVDVSINNHAPRRENIFSAFLLAASFMP